MTQGIYVGMARPASKKAIKQAVADGMAVYLEATSIMGNEYDGPVDAAPDGTYFFVGPDPYRNRKYTGQIIVKAGKVTVK